MTIANLPDVTGPSAASGRHPELAAAPAQRIVFVQTQAEGAGAQEIARIVANGLAGKGYDTHHVFFFRRTAVFDDQANVFFCSAARPSGPISIARMMLTLVRHLSRIRPDVAICFQHYGNIVGGLAAWFAG